MIATNTTAEYIEGERRRDVALEAVTANKAERVWRAQLAILEAMRGRADRTGTGDAATPPGRQWRGNAPWIGAAVRQLAIQGLIHRVGTVRSSRPSRHANEVKLWKLANDSAADTEIAGLRRVLDVLDSSEEKAGGVNAGSNLKGNCNAT